MYSRVTDLSNLIAHPKIKAMADGDKTVQPTGRARGRARGRPRTAEELAAMRRPGETTTTPATTAQGDHDCYRGMLVQPDDE